MADLLDAVVDIHDKLHMDVLFNPSRDSSSSSVTIQSKVIRMERIIARMICIYVSKDHFSDHFQTINAFFYVFSDIRRHFGKSMAKKHFAHATESFSLFPH